MIKCSTILLLAIAVASVSSQKPCCFPEQWEGLLSGTVAYAPVQGPPGVETFYGTLNVDFKINKLFAAEIFGKLKLNLHVLQDINKGVQYNIYPDNKTCTQQPLDPESFRRCIPDSATYAGRYSYGIGDTFTYDGFTIQESGFNEFIGVSSKNCVPFGGSVQYSMPGQTSIFETFAFVNLTAGIKDPSVFDLPSYCTSVEEKPLYFKVPGLGFSHHGLFQKPIKVDNFI